MDITLRLLRLEDKRLGIKRLIKQLDGEELIDSVAVLFNRLKRSVNSKDIPTAIELAQDVLLDLQQKDPALVEEILNNMKGVRSLKQLLLDLVRYGTQIGFYIAILTAVM
jgi:hypothetical protein